MLLMLEANLLPFPLIPLHELLGPRNSPIETTINIRVVAFCGTFVGCSKLAKLLNRVVKLAAAMKSL